ncbi:MAG TPA: hypothetical protein VN675_05500 [Burkholderiales bacterium]|nr:hypothetical protein [Burkholderiales bacterium]
MNPTAIYSKSGKGVQEASGKTSFLERGDRAVLSAIDGRATLADVAQKVGKSFDNAFQTLISKLDKDGFIREASPGAASKTAAPAAKAPAGKPAAKPAADDSGGDLDFSSLGVPKAAPAPSRPAAPPPRPAAPPPPPPPRPNPAADAQAKAQQSALQKAREEAEAKADAERQRVKLEAEAKMRTEMEAKARSDAEKKMKEEAEARAKAEADAKIKAARDAAAKAAAEAKAKADAEAKARVEAERKAREEAERARKAAEEEARKAREEAERVRKAAEEEARKAREEAERARKEAERARKEAEEAARKAREEAERKAKEEAEKMRRQHEEERKREEAERAERRKREDAEEAERRKARDEEDRRAEEERAAKRKQREEEDAAERREEEERSARRKREQEEEEQQAAPKAKKKKEEAPAKSEAAGGLDSLMADLDSFTTREESDRKEKEEAERKAKEVADRRAREDAERREREEAERQKKEEARARKEEEKRRKREEEEELARTREKEEKRLHDEEERRKKEADERERKAKADEVLAAKATRGPAVAVGEDTDEVRKRMMGRRGGGPASVVEPPSLRRKKSGWGKPVAMTLVLLLVAAVGAVHVMPVSTGDYERAASEAFGKPVKIGEARLSLIGGLEIKLKDIRLGDDVRIANGSATPEFEALRGEKKTFTRIELSGVKLPQEAIGQALLAKVKGDNFTVNRLVLRNLEVTGAAKLPEPLEAELVYGEDGALRSATIRGPDTLLARITPAPNGVEFVVTASGFPLPILPEVTLSDFGMKGTASQRGMTIAEWGGKIFGGSVSGTANLRWSGGWSIDGVVTARNINAAVFAPALLSEGKGEGTGRFSMSGPEPAKLGAGGRLEGNFTISSGVLGSFDLGRVIRTSGKEYAGRTQFNELSGQATYDRGAVSLRNVAIGAGALNAGASADIAQSGALTGRIVADVKSSSGGRAVSATLHLGGTIKEPQVKN